MGTVVPLGEPSLHAVTHTGGFRWERVLLVGVGLVLLVSRRPDALLNPQFFAEDGHIFHADAHNYGAVRSLLLPYAGFLHLVPRVVGSLAQSVPLAWAPAVWNLVGLLVRLLPAALFLSPRFAAVVPSRSARVLLAFAYLGLPNSSEAQANVVNGQTPLALMACMLVLVAPVTRASRLADTAVVGTSALTGPFSILLAPEAAWCAYRRRTRRALLLAVVLLVGALTQLVILSTDVSARPHGDLAASGTALAKILAGQVFVAATVGQAGYTWLLSQAWWDGRTAIAVAVVGLGLMLYALRAGPAELRLFVLFAAFAFGAELLSPVVPPPRWPVLAAPGSAVRYWFAPSLAFAITVGYLAVSARRRPIRVVAVGIACLMPIGIALDWRYPALPPDLRFADHVAVFEHAPRSTVVHIPIPPGFGWQMTLLKR